MDSKKILIELPIDVYTKVARMAKADDRSVRSMVNKLVKDGLRGERNQNE